MPNARDVTQFPARSAIQDEVSFKCIVPISTGGLPSPTGAIGVPSGVTAVMRMANKCGVSRIGVGLYHFGFAGAPNGSIRAWVELQAASAPGVVDIIPVKRDVATGYAQLQCFGATGFSVEASSGSVLGFEFVAFSTGNAAGP